MLTVASSLSRANPLVRACTLLRTRAPQDIERVRAAYGPFLSEYPLCYGYWKRYADAELRPGGGGAHRAREVYEAAVAAVPYSIDIWVYYAAFEQQQQQQAKAAAEAEAEAGDGTGAGPDGDAAVRSVFERGTSYCGTDYQAHNLWDRYIAFEMGLLQQQQHQQQPDVEPAPPAPTAASLAVAALYSRILSSCPIKELERYWNACRDFAVGRRAEELCPADELASLQQQHEQEEQQRQQQLQQMDSDGAAGAEGEAVPPPPLLSLYPEAADALVALWLRGRETAFDATRRERELRRPFEEGIRRPYFHAKPLDGAQLANWARYLDWAEGRYGGGGGGSGSTGKGDALDGGGDQLAHVVHLYERCLVPCASYPEFWIRYARWAQAAGQPERGASALQRGLSVFCKRRPEMHLYAAHVEELRGAAAAARRHYDTVLDDLAPGSVAAVVAAANFERRQGQKQQQKQEEKEEGGGVGGRDAACGRYEKLLAAERTKLKTDKGSGGAAGVFEFVALQYASFLRHAFGDVDAARRVLHDALDASPAHRGLWEGAVAFEEAAGGPDAAQRVLQLYERCTAPPPPAVAGAAAKEEEETAAAVAKGQQQEDSSNDAAAAAAAALSEADREELSCRAVAFADLHADAQTAAEVAARHQRRFMAVALAAAAAGADSRKRAPSAAAAGAAKVPRYDQHGAAMAAAAPSSAAAAGYYPPAAAHQAAAAAAYGPAGAGYGGYGGPAGTGGYAPYHASGYHHHHLGGAYPAAAGAGVPPQ